MWHNHFEASNANNIQDYFAKHCFPSALRLQHCITVIDIDSDERKQALFGIQRLIALHVVLPARANFFAEWSVDYSDEHADWGAVRPVTKTFRRLLSEMDGGVGKSSMNKVSCWKASELVPDFFETATRAVPRDNFRKQTHEAPWLETLFVAAIELGFSMSKEEHPTDTYFKKFLPVLERLFRIVLDRNVKLSTRTLLSHARWSGIARKKLVLVDWRLLATFIKLGVDIFLPNSGHSTSEGILNELLETIMLYWRKGASDGNYETIKKDVVIPLMRGFTDARDFPTFMELYSKQLITMEKTRLRHSELSYTSVWEDEDVCNAFSELALDPFVTTHIAAQIKEAATEITSENNELSTSPSAYARFVMLEATLRRRKLDFEAADEALLSIVKAMTAAIKAQQPMHWRWRLWRLARSLLDNNLPSKDNTIYDAIVDLVGDAVNSIRLSHQNLSNEPCAPLESLEAFRFILVALGGKTYTKNWDGFDSLIGEVSRLLGTVANSGSNSQWDGRLETLNSLTSLALGYQTLLVSSPAIWGQIEAEQRRGLFTHMLSLAAAQHDSRSSSLDTCSSGARFLQSWASIICQEYLFFVPCIVSDLVHVLVEHIKADASKRRFYVQSLQRIPAYSLTRLQVGNVLNALQDTIVQENNTPEATVEIVSLMGKLADLPKSHATVTKSWEPIWKMAEAVSLQGTEVDLQLIKAFQTLDRAVIAKLVALSAVERKKLFPKLIRKLKSMASNLGPDDKSMSSVLLRASLTHLWAHREQVSNVVEESDLLSCREKVFKSVVDSLKHARNLCGQDDGESTIPIIKALNALDDFEDLAIRNKDVAKLLGKIEGNIEMSSEAKSTLSRLIRRCVLAMQEPQKEITDPMTRCAEVYSILKLFNDDQQRFITLSVEKFRSMEMTELVQTFEKLTKRDFVKEGGENRLVLAALLVAAMPSIEDKESREAHCLSSLYSEISKFLPHCKTVEQFSLATGCLGLLFRIHPRCASQLNIDILLSELSSCLSRYGPSISSRHASTIYKRICGVLGMVLGIIRLKVNGRNHMLVNILKRLLNCLLNRSGRPGRAVGKGKDQPNWLAPLQASDAENLTRLLTSLSDPTVSAVSRPSGSDALIDQTKKAKGIASQYLRGFIMDYSRMCLQGTFSPEIKAALMPGLYSVMTILSRESMQALNTELEVSSRAVFKGLYDDYIKFGKWNKG